MSASESSFTSIDDDGVDVYLADEWPGLVAAVKSLTAYFLAKQTTGTEPADVLHGIAFGKDGQTSDHLDWRIFLDSNDDVLFQENTGTQVSPTWTTRLTINDSGITVAAHAASHQHGGADEVATATPGANAIVKADGDGKIGAGWIDDADIDHGSVGGLSDDDHTQYSLADGSRNVTGLQTFENGIATDTIAEENVAAGVTVDGCLIKDGVAADADTLDGVQGSSYARLDVAEEFTKAKGSTESAPTVSTAGALTLDFDASNYFEVTVDTSISSITINNTGKPGTRVIKFTQDTGGGNTIGGWPTAVNWPGGTAPVLTTTASAVDIVTILVDSAGNMFGVFSQDFS